MLRSKFLTSLFAFPSVIFASTTINDKISPTRIYYRKLAKRFFQASNGAWDPGIYTYDIHYLEGTLIEGTPEYPTLMDVDRIYITSHNSTKPRIERKLDKPFRLNPTDIWMLSEHSEGKWLMLETRIYAH